MKLTTDVILNVKSPKENVRTVDKAAEKSLKNVVVDIANDVIKLSPKLTGNNARSIMYKIEHLTGLIYSTSGYGGFLETGTFSMPARPYFKPALDKNLPNLPKGMKAELK